MMNVGAELCAYLSHPPKVLTLMGHNPTRRHATSKVIFGAHDDPRHTPCTGLVPDHCWCSVPAIVNGSFIGNGTIGGLALKTPFNRPRKALNPMVPFALRPLLVPRISVPAKRFGRPYSPVIPGILAWSLQTFSTSRNSALPGGKFR